ncbi:holliday junction ATP-dependent DNA helicase RuvA [Candidatus Omnitrophus magneticus]|uniref:Holliday junction branch migration complex subunit RuvA n=1 Tax=Candidatus Omnitrophus magneticus TaxID=1609969 RepID=A0A0F0CRL0_9BACT|nr:holliday junction ATP-dependent DNA helicase RuvA [Candidatus Omnitrophus magneticus]
MISRISGKVVTQKESALIINNGGIFYEVFVPPAVIKSLEHGKKTEGEVELVTYHYYQMEPSRGVPVLIGFENEIEKEFFEKFITVSGIGPKAACKALVEPFSVTAGAIDRGDINFLKKLPGIGEQRARLIVAKLQGKVAKYGLIRDEHPDSAKGSEDYREEALIILTQLQYKRSEAEDMIKKAMERNPKVKTCEELLSEVYKQKKVVVV